MERKMHRKDRELPLEECWELLAKGDHGVLAVVGDEGWPYAVPINYIIMDRKLYLHCAKKGYKLDAIARDSRVCFSVVLKSDVIIDQVTTEYESVNVFGNACVTEDEVERLAALDHLIDDLCEVTPEIHKRYIEKLGPRTAVIRIEPTLVTGKANRKYKPVEERIK